MNDLLLAVRSWLWVPLLWVLVYPITVAAGVIVGVAFGEFYYVWGTLLLAPLIVAPVTYRQLVGGGCSVRFQICALVKGMLAGFVLLLITVYMDPLVWTSLSSVVGWNPLLPATDELVYYVWLFSATIGGMGARVVEVRGYSEPANITIAGFE
jgi:hypothetical protein